MTLVGRDRLFAFAKRYNDSRRWIRNWIADVEEAVWKTPQDVMNRYPSVDMLPDGAGFIFNVKGNDYRLQAQVSFGTGVVSVVRIGTHDEYKRWFR